MSEIVAFDFEGAEVRTIHKGEEPWFVAMDVCKALGLSNPHKAIESLDDDEKDEVTLSDSIGRQQEMNIINESGLYILILRSRNAERRYSAVDSGSGRLLEWAPQRKLKS